VKLNEGTVVGGRYEIVREIATGGMGVVYEVKRTTDGGRFAMKVVRQRIAKGATVAERLKREAQVLARLDHPGIVKMVDAGLADRGSIFIVMELLEGETLLSHLKREAPVAPAAMVPIVDGIASALDAVHGAGFIHRDLKPSNVVLTPSGIKLLDFGVAHGPDYVRLTVTGQVVGTVRYMSPEQLTGADSVDHRTDVYALGVIIWSALAGGPPFVGNPLEVAMQIADGAPRLDVLLPRVDRDLADVVHHAIALQKRDRPASAGELAASFRSLAGDLQSVPDDVEGTGFLPIPATQTSVTEQMAPRVTPRRRPRVPPTLYLAVGVLLGVLLTVGAFLLVRGGDAESPPSTASPPTEETR
jgi:serine/threonine-protein kinase